MSPAIRRLVLERAEGYCEYCQIHYQETVLRHHVDHIQSRQHGGMSSPDNLAFACHHCNEHKGTNLAGIDPETKKLSRLFHPRHDQWDEHFSCHHGEVLGKTTIGRTTVELFRMNVPARVKLRSYSHNK